VHTVSCASSPALPRAFRNAAVRSGRWTLALAALLLAACATIAPQLEPPRLEVTGVGFAGGDLARQQIRLTLHVTNPNARAIAVRRIDYGIALADTDFARGTTSAPFTVPASGATDFELQLTADMLTALKVLGRHLGERSVPYRVTGTVHLAAGVLRALPFASNGSLPLR